MLMTEFGRTVEEWVEEAPETLLILDQLRLDFAQVRETPLDAVCRSRGIDPYSVSVMLKDLREKGRLLDDPVLRTYDIPQLIGYVLINHHHYMDEELPRLEKDLEWALLKEGGKFPELFPLQLKVRRFLETFREHMREEEAHFFPYFSMLASDPQTTVLDPKGLEELTDVVRKEDLSLVEDLDAIRQATRWYHTPPGAGEAYRNLIHRLFLLEIDLRRHMEAETRVLFPKVLELAAGVIFHREFGGAPHDER
jgi:regulator of cell morphogenesis and NO signaling